MTNPLVPGSGATPEDPDLASMLEQVDVSRVRTQAIEDQLVAESDDIYAQALVAYLAVSETPVPEDEEGHPILTAVMLAAAVALIRRAFARGSEEGASYASAMTAALKLPLAPFVGATLVSGSTFADTLVSDFLGGQSAGASEIAAQAPQTVFSRIADRARVAVTSALFGGRGVATQSAFAKVAEIVKSQVHKLWVARFDISDVCGYCVRLHGTHVPIGDDFPVPSSEPAPYGGLLLRPPRHPNCRCHIVLYFPALQLSDPGVSPWAMASYGSSVLLAAGAKGNDYVRATVVHVEPYIRVVNGKSQQVGGYYYDVETGLKIPESQASALPSKSISAGQAKALTEKSKVAKASVKGDPTTGKFGPGTYEVSLPGGSTTQVIVHKDGTSSAVNDGNVENSNPATTKQFLQYWDAQGAVSKVSSGDGGSGESEPTTEQKAAGLPAPGTYVLPNSKKYDGFEVEADNSLTVYSNDFKTKTKISNAEALSELGSGKFGEFLPVSSSEFKPGWEKNYQAAQDAEETASAVNASNPKNPSWFVDTPPGDITPADQLDAIEEYVGASSQFNDPLRSEKSTFTPDDDEEAASKSKQISALDSMMKPSGEKQTVYRQVASTKFMGDLNPGDVYEEKAFLSTTQVEGGLGITEFGNNLLTIEVPKGTPLMDVQDHLFDELNESEILMARNTRLQVVSKTGAPGSYKIKMKVVPAKPLTKKVQAAATVMPWDKSNDAEFTKSVPTISEPDLSSFAPEPKFPTFGSNTVKHSKLFPVGSPGQKLSLAVDEGTQVFEPSSEPGVLYTLSPNGDLNRHTVENGQLTTKLMGSAANPPAAAKLLAGMTNVSNEGQDVPNVSTPPGTKKASVGGVEMTSTQLDDAITLLTAQKSHSLSSVKKGLADAGSPLASSNLEAVAAPYGHLFKTDKPAVIKALKEAKASAGVHPLGAVAQESKLINGPIGPDGPKLDSPGVNYGLSDGQAIAEAVEALSPSAPEPGYGSEGDGPGLISVQGLEVSPGEVAQAIAALKAESSTSVKGPLKSSGSALAKADLQGLANDATGTKVHYGKLKPAVIKALEDALAKHQTAAPATPAPSLDAPGKPGGNTPDGPKVADVPPKLITVSNFVGDKSVSGTPAQLAELRAFVADMDLSEIQGYGTFKVKLQQGLPDNPFSNAPYSASSVFPNGTVGLFGKSDSNAKVDAIFAKLIKEYKADTSDHKVKTNVGKSSGSTTPDSSVDSIPVSFPFISGSTVEPGAFQGTVGDLKKIISDLETKPSFAGLPEDGPLSGATLPEMAYPSPLADLSLAEKKPIVLASLQAKLDAAVSGTPQTPASNLAPHAPSTAEPAASGSAPSASVPVGGVTVTKAQLLDAIASLKGEISTSVKGPLKGTSPLAKADLKAFAETHAGGGTIHYGKLKPAVIEALQAQADSMDDAPNADAPSAPNPVDVVTPAAPEPPAPATPKFPPGVYNGPTGKKITVSEDGTAQYEVPGLDPANVFVQDVSFNYKTILSGPSWSKAPDSVTGDDSPSGPEPAGNLSSDVGTYTYGGSTLVVSADGSAKQTLLNGTVKDIAPGQVQAVLALGYFEKQADTPAGNQPGFVNGMKIGVYDYKSADGSPASAHVLPNGKVVLKGGFGSITYSGDAGKSLVQSLGVDPTPGKSPSAGPDAPDGEFVEHTLDSSIPSYNGQPTGTYVSTDGDGETVEFGESGYITFPSGGFYAPDSFVGKGFLDGLNSSNSSAQWLKVGVHKASDGTKLHVGSDGSLTFESPTGSTSGVPGGIDTNFSKKFADYKYAGASPLDSPPPGMFGQGNMNEVELDNSVPEGYVLLDTGNGYSIEAKQGEYEWNDGKISVLADGNIQFSPDHPSKGLAGQTFKGEDAPESVIDALESETFIKYLGNPNEPSGGTDSEKKAEAFVPPADSVDLGTFPGGSAPFYSYDKKNLAGYFSDWVAKSPYAGVAGLHLNSLTKHELETWGEHWANGEFDKAFALESKNVKNHKGKGKHPGDPKNPANANGFTKPFVLAAVPGEYPAGSLPPGNWQKVNDDNPTTASYQTPGPLYWPEDEIDNYILKAGMANPTGLSSYEKKNWVHYHFNGNKDKTDKLSIQAKKNVEGGYHKSDPVVPPGPVSVPGQAVPLPAGHSPIDLSKASADNLTLPELNSYIAQMAPPTTAKHLLKQPEATKRQLVALHAAAAAPSGSASFKPPAQAKEELQSILLAVSAGGATNFYGDLNDDVVQTIHQKLSVSESTFTLDKDQPHLVSTQTLYHISDQNGKKYLFKVAAEPFRADAEHAGHVLAGLSGLKTAESRVGQFQGKHGQFQAKLDSKSTLIGVDIHQMPISALKDVMSSHVFDWSVNNDDGADRNFLLSPDGKRVYPIDLGRAFANFGSSGMKLKVGSISDRTHTIYEDIYKDILKKKFSDSDTDAMYFAMISQAKRQQNVDDTKWSDAIKEGSKDRPNFSTSTANNVDQLAAQGVLRKNSLVADFEKFWDDIYSELGRSKPEPAKSKLDQHVRTGNTADWHAHAGAMGPPGSASFFSGTSLEEGHILAQKVFKSAGKPSAPAAPSAPSAPSVKLKDVSNAPTVKVGNWMSNDDGVSFVVKPDGSVSTGDDDDYVDPALIADYFTDSMSSMQYMGPEGGPISPEGVKLNEFSGSVSDDSEMWFSGKLRPEVAGQFEAWLATHSSNKINSGSLSSSSSNPTDKTQIFLQAQGLANADSVITEAAKTISHHNSKGDQEYNASKINNFESFKSQLDAKLTQVNNGTYPPELAEVDQVHYKQLLESYSGKIKFVENLKNDGGQSKSGDIASTSFKLSPPPTVKPDVTSPNNGFSVKSVAADYESFSLDENNVMVKDNKPIKAMGDYESYNGTEGSMYKVTLPDGTEVEYFPYDPSADIVTSQRGEFRIKVRNYDGTASSTNSGFDFFSQAGVPLEESSDEDMELLYWRHMYGAMANRSDTNVGPQAKVKAAVATSLPGGALGTPALTKAAELEAWRAAWSNLAGQEKVNTWVEKRGFLPRFSRGNPAAPEEVGGQPYWYRFDLDYNNIYKNKTLPKATTTHDTMPAVMKSGAMYSSEDRMKILALWTPGSYGSAHQDQRNDSSNNVYFRQNQEGSSFQYYSTTLTAAHTTSYAWNADKFGEASYKPKLANWDYEQHTSHGSGGNELMTKRAVTILDDMEMVAFHTKQARDGVIAQYKGWGITEIRGLPLEKRFVLSNDADAALKVINNHRKTYDIMAEILPD